MVLIVFRVILFLILALVLGIETAFSEQKMPVYILFILFVALAIFMNVWITHKNIKENKIKFNKHVAYFLGVVSGLLYIGFYIYALTIGDYDLIPIIILIISMISITILESILGINLRNAHISNKQLKVISKQRVHQCKVIFVTSVCVSIILILIALMLKWWLLLAISIIILVVITIAIIVYEKYYTTSD